MITPKVLPTRPTSSWPVIAANRLTRPRRFGVRPVSSGAGHVAYLSKATRRPAAFWPARRLIRPSFAEPPDVHPYAATTSRGDGHGDHGGIEIQGPAPTTPRTIAWAVGGAGLCRHLSGRPDEADDFAEDFTGRRGKGPLNLVHVCS